MYLAITVFHWVCTALCTQKSGPAITPLMSVNTAETIIIVSLTLIIILRLLLATPMVICIPTLQFVMVVVVPAVVIMVVIVEAGVLVLARGSEEKGLI